MAEIVDFPHDDFSFKPCDFQGESILTKYRANEAYLEFCQSVLSLPPKKLKAKVRSREFKQFNFDGLVDDLEEVAKDCIALSEMLTTARARLIAVQARLV